MKTNNDIDDLFKDIIEPYEMNHSEKVWQSLDNQLDKKANENNKSVIFRLRISLGILLFLFGSFTFYYFFNSQRTNNKSSVALLQKITKSNVRSGEKRNSSSNAKTNGDTLYNKISKNINDPTPQNNATIKQAKNNDYLVNVKISELVTLNKSSFESTESLVRKPLDRIPLPSNLQSVINEVASIDDTANENHIKEIETIPTISDNILVSTNNFDTNLVAKTITTIPILSKEKMDSIQQRQFKNRLSFIAYFSPDLTLKYLKDNDKTDNENEGDYNSKEVPDFSFNAGLLVGYDLSKNWSIKFGGTYAYLAQTIKPKTVYAKTGTDGLAHYQFNTSYGTSELPRDQNPVPTIGDSLNINSNSVQSLQIIGIPIISKFQITKNKFSYYTQLGLSINFLAAEKLIVQTPNQPETIRTLEGLNEYYIGGMFGLGVSYNPSKKISILIEPTIRGAVTPINKNKAVTTRPISFGMILGLGWHF